MAKKVSKKKTAKKVGQKKGERMFIEPTVIQVPKGLEKIAREQGYTEKPRYVNRRADK
jgi:hypothetical protein